MQAVIVMIVVYECGRMVGMWCDDDTVIVFCGSEGEYRLGW